MAKPIVFTFVADAKKLKAGLSEAERDMRQLGRSVSRAGKGMTIGVTAPLVAIGAGAIKAASEFEQSAGAIESVFGEAAKTIEEFGETSAQSFGLSKRAANELGARLGASLRGMGFEAQDAANKTVALQKRAADLAATFGGPVEDAVDAIASLLRGERDPIERFGVSIKQADVNARVLADGLDTSTTAAKKMSEATAALDLLMETTASSAGQFAREQDTFAGQSARLSAELENLKVALGNELLPVVTDGVTKVNDLTQAFVGLPAPMQGMIVKVGVAAAAAGPLLIATGSIIRNLDTIRTSAPLVGKALGKAGLAGAMLITISVANDLGEAIGDALNLRRSDIDAQALNNDLQRLALGVSEVGSELTASFSDPRFGIDGLGDAVDRLTSPSMFDRLADATSAVSGFLSFNNAGDTAGARGLRTATEAIAALDRELTNIASSHGPGAAEEALFRFVEAEGLTAEQTEALVFLLTGLKVELDRQGLSADGAAGATADLGSEQKDAAVKVKTLTDRLDDQINMLAEAADPVLRAIGATNRWEEAQDNLNEVIKKYGEHSPEAEDATTDLVDATLKMLSAANLTAGEVDEFTRTMDVLKQAGLLTEKQIHLLTAALNDLPDSKTIDIRLTGNGASGIEVANDPTNAPQFRAHGGPALAGNPYIVGEKGPELFVPHMSGNVIPNHRVQGGDGGEATALNLTVNYPEPERLSTSLPSLLRDAAWLAGVN